MRREIFWFSVALLMMVFACKDSGEQATTSDVIDLTGTVLEKSAQFYVIECDVPIHSGVRTCYPINLSDPFRHDHLRVRFSGMIEVDPATQYLYVPLRLSFIQSIH
jgi:hypothetical protein